MALRLAPLALFLLSTCALAAVASDVLTLDNDTFDSAVAKHDFLVAEFYAPWCGHCKKLDPEYEKAAKQLKEDNIPIVLAKIDADAAKNKPLAARFGVEGFPTLKIFRKDAPVTAYNGPREADGIVNYLKRQVGPPSLEIGAPHVADIFFGDNKVTVVGLFKEFAGPEYDAYIRFAGQLRDEYSFGHTKDAALLPPKGPPLSPPAVRLFKDFDEEYNDITEFDEEKLKEFVTLNTIPLVVEMTKEPKDRDVLMKVFNSPLNKVLCFFDYAGKEGNAFLESYKKAAGAYQGELNFIVGDVLDNEHALKYFGVSEDDAPLVIVHDQKVDKKFIEKGIKPDGIQPFLEKYTAGKLQPSIKSEEVPKENDGPVKVLVASNFEEEVLNSRKNVLIEFYAPWCGHCKQLTPIYEELGKELEKDTSVVIAKIDATANDILSHIFEVKGFPTLYLYTAAGQVVPYEGNRTKKDMLSFVNKHKEEPSSSADEAEAMETASESSEASTLDEEVEVRDEL